MELIAKGRATESHRAPLLFVHGAWHAAWCWDEHFLDYFAEHGYHCLALSLRGHGLSPTPRALRACSLADYVDDVTGVANTLSTRPVVVGHSMGGLIVQKYLESNDAPAGVLMASTSPRGAAGFSLRWARRHPWHVTKSMLTGRSVAYVNTPELAREKFFSARTPDAVVERCAVMLQEESRRVALDALILNLPNPSRVSTPVLVLGATDDGTISNAEVRTTATAFDTAAEFFPMGHDMMLETGWQTVADRIRVWLGGLGL